MLTELAAVTPKLSWYIARSSGVVSWVLVTASVLWGLVVSARVLNRHTVPGWLLDLHRFLGAISIVLTGIHLAGLVGDNWLHFGWIETLVPMRSPYRPVAVAWGIVGFYLLVAVEITSLLRSRLPRRVWRSTHYLSFPVFALCTVHALTAGTDSHLRAYEWLTVGSVTATMVLLVLRIIATRPARESRGARSTPASEVSTAAERGYARGPARAG